ncbi:MAG: DUF1570 domain-containing protein [Planctomycetota bacterium]|nr:MAG: DUF1570 domain-containing protein [Planctomycetota bacterium]
MYRIINKNKAALLLAILTGLNLAWADSDDIPINQAQENALLRATGPEFEIKRTPHFLIAFDTERSLVNDLVSRLEYTYHAVYRFCKACKINARQPNHRLEVIFFNNREKYDRYSAGLAFASAGTYGMYYEPTNRSAFFNAINGPQMTTLYAGIITYQDRLNMLLKYLKNIKNNHTPMEIEFNNGRCVLMTKKQVEKEIASAQQSLKTLDKKRKVYSEHINQTVIQHETAHQVLFNAGIHIRGAENPIWLVEGLACLFETPPSATGTGFAVINQQRLKDFRSAVAGSSSKHSLKSNDFLEALRHSRITPLQDLITNPHLLNREGQSGATQYALAWALTHYLHRVKTKQFAAYLQDFRSRKSDTRLRPADQLALFEKHFGPIDKTFQKRWGNYILGLKVRSTGPKL